MRRRRHPSLSLSPLSRRKSRFSSSFIYEVPLLQRSALASRSKTISLFLSLSSSIYHISFILLWISNLIGRSFFKNLKKEIFQKINNTFKQKRARIHTSHRIHAAAAAAAAEKAGALFLVLRVCVFLYIHRERELFF